MSNFVIPISETAEAPPNGPLRVVGIDLGTTNSTVCEIVWEPGQDGPGPPRCLNIDQKTTQGRYTHVLVPSVVACFCQLQLAHFDALIWPTPGVNSSPWGRLEPGPAAPGGRRG